MVMPCYYKLKKSYLNQFFISIDNLYILMNQERKIIFPYIKKSLNVL